MTRRRAPSWPSSFRSTARRRISSAGAWPSAASLLSSGAPEKDDNGWSSGAAYVFDATTGLQIAKLLPLDGATGGRFWLFGGYQRKQPPSSDPHTTATTVTIRGQQYLFDATTGVQTFKLIASSASLGSTFGISVGISGSTAIVGRQRSRRGRRGVGCGLPLRHDDGCRNRPAACERPPPREATSARLLRLVAPGRSSVPGRRPTRASPTLFDTSSGNQLAKLLPRNRSGASSFGFRVALDRTTAILNSGRDDDAPFGAAYLFDTEHGRRNGQAHARRRC